MDKGKKVMSNDKRYFFCLRNYARYKESYSSDDDLINHKKLTNKDIFMSEYLFNKFQQLDDRAYNYGNRLEDYVGRLEANVRNNYSNTKDMCIVGCDEMGRVMLYKREYGVAVVRYNAPEPPEHLQYDPEDFEE